LLAESLAEGRLRAYLKALSDKTWDLSVWLQHYADATPWDAELTVDATAHVLGAFLERFVVTKTGRRNGALSAGLISCMTTARWRSKTPRWLSVVASLRWTRMAVRAGI
jgi:hypothetical protein